MRIILFIIFALLGIQKLTILIMKNFHSFHIPVMGLGFTVDSPIKVAQYGIDSVISIGDDMLLEKMRMMYSELFEIPYQEISDKIDDFRAKRITSYLNLVNDIVDRKIEELKSVTSEKADEIKKYFSILPDTSEIKAEFFRLKDKYLNFSDFGDWISDNIYKGSIDVNIMTKLDREYYDKNGEKLPVEYNDAHAALRGFAESNLESSIVLSAGMNPRLYGYIGKFEDFYPNEEGYIRKKIVLKVSDYRSALIQGKFLAKKGIWISEYRIESGLNCGGHAFASDGYLMGPILEEFNKHREDLEVEVFKILSQALIKQGRTVPSKPLKLKLTAQGGVGTANEHEFLLEHYNVDSVGWGSPFLLAPDVTTVDNTTLQQLVDAREKDIYLSDLSPLGVPFNSLRGDTGEIARLEKIAKGRPGSSCPKLHLNFNTEFTEKPICTASRQYQRLKLKELDKKELNPKDYKKQFDAITAKSCLCVGLGTAALVKYDIERRIEGDAVLVCPGPNTAYFNKETNLEEMSSHIYGRKNIMPFKDRPNMFVKELKLYIDYLKDQVEKSIDNMDKKQDKYLNAFVSNLRDGIEYYKHLFNTVTAKFDDSVENINKGIEFQEKRLDDIEKDIANLALELV